MKERSILRRIDPNFDKKLKELSLKRYKNDIDKDGLPRNNRELTKMILNAPSFSKVEQELIKMPRIEDLK